MKKTIYNLTVLLSIIALNEASADNSNSSQSGNDENSQFIVKAKKIENSRNNISTKTGGSSYQFTKETIENLPQGQFTSLNQVLLRAPGVVQDSFGQLHIRADHSNIQYRINGVMIPEGISGFGQIIDTNFIDNIDLLTGALPAQYGFRTAGVVDIKSKTGEAMKDNRSSVMMGSKETLAFNQQIGGFTKNSSYHLNGSYLTSNRAIEAPYRNNQEINNDTKQNRLFGHFSHLIDAETKLNLIIANSQNNFQIPNTPNQEPQYSLNGVDTIRSQDLRQKQNEHNSFAIASINGTNQINLDYQLSIFSRLSETGYFSDERGDLIFNGVSSNIKKRSLANGSQLDLSYPISEKQTLRTGLYLSSENAKHYQNSKTFITDSDGYQASSDPINIANGNSKTTNLFALYAQNEIKPIKPLTVNIGARFDKIKSTSNESQISPRIGAVYEFNQKTKIHSGFARYITPARAELLASSNIENFRNTTNESVNNEINDKIKAERSSYYDIGINHQLNKNFTIGIDSYYKKIRNLLDEGQFGKSLIYTPFNYQSAKAHGLEISTDYKKDNLKAYFNISAQKMKAKKIISSQYAFAQDELDYIANHYVNVDHDQSYSASSGASYLYKKNLVAIDGIYGSGLRHNDYNGNKLKSYYQVNFALARDIDFYKVNNINARLSALNILNQKYKIRDGSGIGVESPQYNAGRVFYLTLSKKF